jgi:hypothetical protein
MAAQMLPKPTAVIAVARLCWLICLGSLWLAVSLGSARSGGLAPVRWVANKEGTNEYSRFSSI